MIELRDVTVRFHGRTVLDGLSAQIPLAGTTVVTGASGSGKTTLLRVLIGLQELSGGNIAGLDGLKLSVVFQEDRLLPWLTALENVSLVSTPASAHRYLCALGLRDALNQKPAALSGGMRRRVAVARALAYGGDLLLLDEPFTGLDDGAKQMCAAALLEQKRPIVLATHSSEEAERLHGAARIDL